MPTQVAPTRFSPTFLYRLLDDDGAVLYIGVTRNLNQRLVTHERNRPVDEWAAVADMSVEVFTDRYEAENAERAAILREDPPWNTQRWHPSPRVDDEAPVVGRTSRKARGVVVGAPRLIPSPGPVVHRGGCQEALTAEIFETLKAADRPIPIVFLRQRAQSHPGRVATQVCLQQLIDEGVVAGRQSWRLSWFRYRVVSKIRYGDFRCLCGFR